MPCAGALSRTLPGQGRFRQAADIGNTAIRTRTIRTTSGDGEAGADGKTMLTAAHLTAKCRHRLSIVTGITA